jgi:perosamine synthetase
MLMQFEPKMDLSYIKEVTKQMESTFVGPGKKVTEFENAICEYTDSSWAIATTSGTIALFLALDSIRSTGKKIIIPNYSFIAAANVINFLGYIPVLIDIKKDTMCLNPLLVEEALKNDSEIEAVVFINHNGYVGEDLIEIAEICNRYGVGLIEDAACGLGQRYNGIHAGCTGTVGTLSFSVPKIITTGQGGMVLTNKPWITSRCRDLIDQGNSNWRKMSKQNFGSYGLNFKFNDILAAYGLAQLNNIETLLNIRQKNFDNYNIYGVNICDFIRDIPVGPWMNIYMAETGAQATDIIDQLKIHDIQAKRMYLPLNESTNMKYEIGSDLCTSYEVANKAVYLPSSLTLQESDINQICKIIRTVIGY